MIALSISVIQYIKLSGVLQYKNLTNSRFRTYFYLFYYMKNDKKNKIFDQSYYYEYIRLRK